ncbi:MAG TPA: glycine cleavage system protein H [Candidatus Hypogeohydataceae bacterium YC41]
MPYTLPKDLKYTSTHEWIRIKGRTAIIGLTEFALEGLGRIIDISLPDKGDELLTGMSLGDVETTNALHEIITPVEGEVIEINKALYKDLDLITKDPYIRGWLIKLRISGPPSQDNLLSAAEYEAQLPKLKKGGQS